MDNSSYKKLRKTWYKKLKESGFKDIEFNDDTLAGNHSSTFYRNIPNHTKLQNPKVVWEAKLEYYTMAEHFLNEHKFENSLEKIIWEYHSNGLSIRSIIKILHKDKVTKTNRDTVWKTIKRLSTEMKKLYQVK